MTMNVYSVSIPIRGTIVIAVEAKERDMAIEKALAECTIDDVEDWETLDSQAETDRDEEEE